MVAKTKKYILKHRNQITLLVFMGIGTSYISYIPYVNLFIPASFYIVALFIAGSLLLRISARVHIVIAVLLLTISYPWLLVGNRISIEVIGVLIFISVLLAVLKEAKIIRRNGKW